MTHACIASFEGLRALFNENRRSALLCLLRTERPPRASNMLVGNNARDATKSTPGYPISAQRASTANWMKALSSEVHMGEPDSNSYSL